MNDKIRVTAECANRGSTGCKWFVHASLDKTNGFFYIRALVNGHNCGSTFRTARSFRMSSELICSKIVKRVHDTL